MEAQFTQGEEKKKKEKRIKYLPSKRNAN